MSKPPSHRRSLNGQPRGRVENPAGRDPFRLERDIAEIVVATPGTEVDRRVPRNESRRADHDVVGVPEDRRRELARGIPECERPNFRAIRLQREIVQQLAREGVRHRASNLHRVVERQNQVVHRGREVCGVRTRQVRPRGNQDLLRLPERTKSKSPFGIAGRRCFRGCSPAHAGFPMYLRPGHRQARRVDHATGDEERPGKPHVDTVRAAFPDDHLRQLHRHVPVRRGGDAVRSRRQPLGDKGAVFRTPPGRQRLRQPDLRLVGPRYRDPRPADREVLVGMHGAGQGKARREPQIDRRRRGPRNPPGQRNHALPHRQERHRFGARNLQLELPRVDPCRLDRLRLVGEGVLKDTYPRVQAGPLIRHPPADRERVASVRQYRTEDEWQGGDRFRRHHLPSCLVQSAIQRHLRDRKGRPRALATTVSRGPRHRWRSLQSRRSRIPLR